MSTKTCFGYTRVSTVKQGEGVSLEAQHEAISAFAARNNLQITRWFEEKETAAKRGRPIFDAVVKALQAGDADGLIVHKIDRSARNFSDWARVGELVDSGIDVHFAHESLDLRSRGGRLTADIQAVIAADYVRNLREECKKGVDGRLKQGLTPWAAPIGYLDQGRGKAKVPDPIRGPLVRQAFELYATGRYSFQGLRLELQRRGLKTRNGRPITKGCFENMLSNPFYYGVIYLKRTDRSYPGIHEPLISSALFKRVMDIRNGKHIKKETLHNHPYRKLITCGLCQRSLIGERQKGHVYYRCHTRDCPTTGIRQDRFEEAVAVELQRWQLRPSDQKRYAAKMQQWLRKQTPEVDKKAIELQLANVAARQDQLTDALLDQLIDKATFLDRKDRLQSERDACETALCEIDKTPRHEVVAQKYLELTKNVVLSHGLANQAQKAELLRIVLSNCTLAGKTLCLETQKWLSEVEETLFTLCGAPLRDKTRTEELINELADACSSVPTAPVPQKPKQQPGVPQWKYNLKNQKFDDLEQIG
ncbi:MAG: recombinase family protein [Yoonia sp.]